MSIIGLSNGLAIATKYNFTFTSKLSFLLKKLIDQNFVKKFNNLNQDNYILKNLFKIFKFINQKNNKNVHDHQMQCRGCAAKVDFNTLKTTLSKEIITSSEDAITINKYPNLYQSVDMINSIVSDPYILGKIAANHAISDIVAVNSSLVSALMVLQLPYSSSEINSRDLEQVTSGANEIFKLANCSIGGGHTMIGKDEDPVIGFSVIGEKKRILQNKITPKVKVNDVLILTEKIGSGIIFAGINNDIIDSYYQIEVINQMSKGNINFSKISEKLKILSMTDVTGFGLLNHLLNLIKRDSGKTGLTIYPDKVPIFNGVTEALSKNVRSSLFDKNFDVAQKELIYDREKKLIDEILYDPQTVGGLAFIIPKEEKVEQIKILRENKINFTEIGFVNSLNNKIKIM